MWKLKNLKAVIINGPALSLGLPFQFVIICSYEKAPYCENYTLL